MASFTVYDGSEKPRVCYGVNQCRMAKFAEKYRGWHTWVSCPAVNRAVAGLVKRGMIETRDYNGFRWI